MVILFFIFTACSNGNEPEIVLEIPPPSVIFTEPIDLYQDAAINPPQEYNVAVSEVDIPSFNEYFVSLEFEPNTRRIYGLESVRYTNRTGQPLNNLVFRVPLNAWDGNEIVAPYIDSFYNSIFRHGRSYGYMDILHVFWDNEELPFNLRGTVLTIDLPRQLELYETVQIHLQFEAQIPQIAHRTGSNELAMWAGAFLPVEAVHGDNGWHTEPLYPVGRPFILNAANYVVEIITPIGYVVAGTGTKEETIRGDQMVTTFTAQRTRDFAFAISPYFLRATQVTPSGREINLYHYTVDLPIDRILSVAVDAIKFFEETVGAYPYPQFSIIETDMFRNSVGFSSVAFMDSRHLRTSQTLSSLRNEIGHQWFSITIGGNPIKESWLSNGLTHFLQNGMIGQPDIHEFIESEHQRVQERLHIMRNENNRRLSTPLGNYDFWDDYFLIQHRKAQLMFYALYQKIGEENFRYLLREYYGRFAFGIATSHDFISLAEEVHGNDLQEFFEYWTHTTDLPALQGTVH